MENGFDSFFLFILFKKVERIVRGTEKIPDSLKLPVLLPQENRKKVSGDSSPHPQTKLETDKTQEYQLTVLQFVLRGQWPEHLGCSPQTTSNRTIREYHGPSWEWWGS